MPDVIIDSNYALIENYLKIRYNSINTINSNSINPINSINSINPINPNNPINSNIKTQIFPEENNVNEL